MKPWYLKKKIWVGFVTALAAGFGYWAENDSVANAILVLGTALIAGLGLEDFGKAGREGGQQAVSELMGTLADIVKDVVAAQEKSLPPAAETPPADEQN